MTGGFGANDEVPVLLVDAEAFLLDVAVELARGTTLDGRLGPGRDGFLGLGARFDVLAAAFSTVGLLVIGVDLPLGSGFAAVAAVVGVVLGGGIGPVVVGALALLDGAGVGCETVEIMLFITFAAPRNRPKRLVGAAFAK